MVVLNRISSAKNALVNGHRQIYRNDLWPATGRYARSNRPADWADIFANYVKRCFKNGAMDFDDLLFKMHEFYAAAEKCTRSTGEVSAYKFQIHINR